MHRFLRWLTLPMALSLLLPLAACVLEEKPVLYEGTAAADGSVAVVQRTQAAGFLGIGDLYYVEIVEVDGRPSQYGQQLEALSPGPHVLKFDYADCADQYGPRCIRLFGTYSDTLEFDALAGHRYEIEAEQTDAGINISLIDKSSDLVVANVLGANVCNRCLEGPDVSQPANIATITLDKEQPWDLEWGVYAIDGVDRRCCQDIEIKPGLRIVDFIFMKDRFFVRPWDGNVALAPLQRHYLYTGTAGFIAKAGHNYALKATSDAGGWLTGIVDLDTGERWNFRDTQREPFWPEYHESGQTLDKESLKRLAAEGEVGALYLLALREDYIKERRDGLCELAKAGYAGAAYRLGEDFPAANPKSLLHAGGPGNPERFHWMRVAQKLGHPLAYRFADWERRYLTPEQIQQADARMENWRDEVCDPVQEVTAQG